MSNEKSKDTRSRAWAVIVYPESAPENWRQIISDTHCKWIESPLHDKDINPDGAEGEKKAHWHVLLLFESPKCFRQIKEISDACRAPTPQRVGSARGAVRYMIHMDEPDKFQYSQADIKTYNGADVSLYFKASHAERYKMIDDMIDYIVTHDVVELVDFVSYARVHRFDDWFPLLCDSCAYIIGHVIKSNRHKLRARD